MDLLFIAYKKRKVCEVYVFSVLLANYFHILDTSMAKSDIELLPPILISKHI